MGVRLSPEAPKGYDAMLINRFCKFFLISGLVFALSSCLSFHKTYKLSLEFKAEQVFKKGKVFKNLKVGGLSELFFDKDSGLFLALSDDKKNHRFYKLALSKSSPYSLKIVDQVFLKSPGQTRLKGNMDPEALVLYGKDKMFIASEGQQIYEVHEPTQIFTFDRQGTLKEAWPVPEIFWEKGRNKQNPFWGQKENKGFESLALEKTSNLLWTATERPLKQDALFKESAFVRLSGFDIQSQKMLVQYPYYLKDKEGGLVALEILGPKVFLSLERAYKKQNKHKVNQVDLFFTDCRRVKNIHNQTPKASTACSKKQLWTSSNKEFPVRVDNLEAMTFGPALSPHKKLLLLASDNNFNEKKQKTQFLFFELSLK